MTVLKWRALLTSSDMKGSVCHGARLRGRRRPLPSFEPVCHLPDVLGEALCRLSPSSTASSRLGLRSNKWRMLRRGTILACRMRWMRSYAVYRCLRKACRRLSPMAKLLVLPMRRAHAAVAPDAQIFC